VRLLIGFFFFPSAYERKKERKKVSALDTIFSAQETG